MYLSSVLVQSMLLLDAFNKDRASLPQPLPNPPPLAPLPVITPDPRTQEMINEKLKKAEDLGKSLLKFIWLCPRFLLFESKAFLICALYYTIIWGNS